MAQQLIESLTADFEPEKYRDEYRDRVLDLIERKAQGEDDRDRGARRGAEEGARPDGGARGEHRRDQEPERRASRSRSREEARSNGSKRQEERPRKKSSWPRAGVEVEVEGRQLSPLQPRTRCCTRGPGFTKGQVIDYYTRDRAGPAAAPARPPAHAQALPERRRGRVLLREELPLARARVGAQGASSDRDRLTASATTCRRSSGWPTSPTSSCTPRSRSRTTSTGRP